MKYFIPIIFLIASCSNSSSNKHTVSNERDFTDTIYDDTNFVRDWDYITKNVDETINPCKLSEEFGGKFPHPKAGNINDKDTFTEYLDKNRGLKFVTSSSMKYGIACNQVYFTETGNPILNTGPGGNTLYYYDNEQRLIAELWYPGVLSSTHNSRLLVYRYENGFIYSVNYGMFYISFHPCI